MGRKCFNSIRFQVGYGHCPTLLKLTRTNNCLTRVKFYLHIPYYQTFLLLFHTYYFCHFDQKPNNCSSYLNISYGCFWVQYFFKKMLLKHKNKHIRIKKNYVYKKSLFFIELFKTNPIIKWDMHKLCWTNYNNWAIHLIEENLKWKWLKVVKIMN